MEGDDAILIVHMEHIDLLTTQGRMAATQADQILYEAQMIYHRLIALLETPPPDQVITNSREIVAPLFVLKKLLAHKEHGNSRGGEHKTVSDPCPTPCIPRTGIRCIAQGRNAR